MSEKEGERQDINRGLTNHLPELRPAEKSKGKKGPEQKKHHPLQSDIPMTQSKGNGCEDHTTSAKEAAPWETDPVPMSEEEENDESAGEKQNDDSTEQLVTEETNEPKTDPNPLVF